MEYTITKTNKGFVLTNVGTQDLNYNLSLKSCFGATLVSAIINTLKPSKSKEIIIGFTDGDYILTLSTAEEKVVVDLPYFENTLKIIIDSVSSLCGSCGCEDCGDCEEDKICEGDKYVLSMTASVSLFFTQPQNFYPILDYLSKVLNCSVIDFMRCMSSKKALVNKEEYGDLGKKIILSFYSIFLTNQLLTATSEEEIDKIKIKFKYKENFKCLAEEGINLDTIIKEITDNTKVYFWQTPLGAETIQTLSQTLTVGILDTKPSNPLNTFLEGYIVPLSSVGKLVFVVRLTNNANFEVLDSLGNNTTEAFDITYNQDLQCAIFLSKNNYTPSNIFFKLKKSVYGQ